MRNKDTITMTKDEREKVLNLLEELSKQIEEKKKNRKKKSFFEKMIEKLHNNLQMNSQIYSIL